MRSAHLALRLFTSLVILALVAFVAACDTTVDDVREWENAKDGGEKMKEYLLDDDNSLEVKVEATMVLVRRHESSSIEAIYEGLSADERAKLVGDVIPQLEKMVNGESQQDAMKAKDGAYYLLQTEPTEEQREALLTLVETWIDSDNFYRPYNQSGLADREMILRLLGPRGVPVIEGAIRDKFDLIKEAKGEAFKNEKANDIKGLVALGEQLNLADTDAMVAKVFAEEYDELHPDVHWVFEVVLQGNKRPETEALAKKILEDDTYTNSTLNQLKAAVINHYYVNVKPKAGTKLCAAEIRDDKSGFQRWMCARTLLKAARDAAIDHVMLNLPESPEDWLLPEDHPVGDQKGIPDGKAYIWYELGAFCRSTVEFTDENKRLEAFRRYAETGNLAQKITAMECLSYLGEPADIQAMAVPEGTEETEATDITAWGHESATTLQEFAAFLVEKHPERKRKLTKRKKK